MGDEVAVHVAAPAYDSGLASESFCFIYQSIIFLVDDLTKTILARVESDY